MPVSPEPLPPPALPGAGRLLAALALLWLVLFALHLAAPSDLMDNDQERPASYLMDCVRNGRWASQRDISGEVMSKPPLYPWLAALATLASGGRGSLFALYLPCGLSVLLTAGLLFAFGGRFFGRGAGFFAAAAFLLSSTSYKQLALARTDPLFAFLTFAAALLAWTAWTRRTGWMGFWLVGAAATLTKGPLGIVFALGGLFAAVWEKRTRPPAELSVSSPPAAASPRWPGMLPGFLAWTALVALWLAAALARDGQDFVDKVLGRELIGHFVASQDKTAWWSFVTPPLYVLGRFAPWSLLAVWAAWKAVRRPAAHPDARRLERFLLCYLASGLFLLCIASHKRADLVFPLLPAAALLAGRELARLFHPQRLPRLLPACAAIACVAVLGFAVFSFVLRPRADKVRETAAVREFADRLRASAGSGFPLSHLDSPYALQFFLDTFRPLIGFAQARELLTGPAPAFVVVKKRERFEAETGLKANALHAVAECRLGDKVLLRILSNHPLLEETPTAAFAFDDLRIRLAGARLVRADKNDLAFHAVSPGGAVEADNASSATRTAVVRLRGVEPETNRRIRLAPGETARAGWNEGRADPAPPGTEVPAPRLRRFLVEKILPAALPVLLLALLALGARRTGLFAQQDAGARWSD